jgi:hypothetical protein
MAISTATGLSLPQFRSARGTEEADDGQVFDDFDPQ